MDLSVFALLVAVAGLMARGEALIRAQLLFCILGTASAVWLPALGGASVTAPWLFTLFLIGRAWLERPYSQPWFRLSRASLWILLAASWGAMSSYYIPRWLAGAVNILTIDRGIDASGPTLMPLRPVSGNLTQSAYAVGGALAFMAVRALISRSTTGFSSFRDAALLLSVLNCACALLNLGEYYAGLPPLLPYVRTSAYKIFDSYESAGLLRIQGTFAETSAFSAFTLPLFVFAAQLWLHGERSRYSGTVAAVSLVLLLLSTSATAYAGLLAYLALFIATSAWKAARGEPIPRASVLLTLAFLTVSIGGFAYALELEPALAVARFVESTLLNKLESPSGIERGSWNAHAWSNFLDTYGLGVGLGGARASSFILVLLSNLGVVGTLLFAGFVVEVLRPRPAFDRTPTSAAARHAVVATLIVASISCPIYDLGLCFYAFCAAACARPYTNQPVSKPELRIRYDRRAPAVGGY